MNKARILLADSNGELLDALVWMLEGEFDVVARAQDGIRLVEAARFIRADLIITEVSLPRLNGFKAVRQLLADQPELRFLFLTLYSDPAFVAEARNLGAAGYVLKNLILTQLIPAIWEALRGGRFFSPSLQDCFGPELPPDGSTAGKVSSGN